jgi:hypothetical protein
MFTRNSIRKPVQSGIALALAALTFMALPTATAQARVTFEIHNASGYEIHYLYLSSTSDPYWRRVGNTVLPSGWSLPVNVVPGRYDLKLVDEDGLRCVLQNIAIYRDSDFYITPQKLLACQFVTEFR